MSTAPVDTPLTIPELDTVAKAGELDSQTAWFVTSWFVLFDNWAIAIS